MQSRSAYYGTNGDQANWLALGETTTMCRFQANDEAKSRIYVDLTTLSSPEPTLAALAYLAKVPMPPSTAEPPRERLLHQGAERVVDVRRDRRIRRGLGGQG